MESAELVQHPELFQTRTVTAEVCQRCTEQEEVTIRPKPAPPKPRAKPKLGEGGSIIYKKEGWEPPPTPPGYRRKSNDLESDDAWVMVPEHPLCQHLKLVEVEKESCGCLRLIPTCKLDNETIQPGQCERCPNKK